MNLIYDHQIFARQRYGGISRYFFELISRLSQTSEVDLTLFLGFFINEYGIEKIKGLRHPIKSWKHAPFPKTSRLFMTMNALWFSHVIAKAKRGIYHQTYYDLLAPDFKGKRIVTVYDMIHELHPSHFSSKETEAVMRTKKLSVEKADGIICISESTKKDLLNHFDVEEDKVKVIYLGNSLDIPINASAIIDGPYILYVGVRGGYKNFSALLTAYARSERIRQEFKIVCFGGGLFNSQEKELIRSFNLVGKVLQQSGSDEILANLYHYATLFVFPSLYEGFGIPLLEAMHYGCPVLASDVSSIPEVLGPAGLYFNPTDIDNLAHNLGRVLYDVTLRVKMKDIGLEQGRRFSWNHCAKETHVFYEKVLSA